MIVSFDHLSLSSRMQKTERNARSRSIRCECVHIVSCYKKANNATPEHLTDKMEFGVNRVTSCLVCITITDMHIRCK